MRRIFTLLCICGTVWVNQAQVQTPKASVPESLKTQVGLTEINIEYSRPSKRDRTLFGEVVPYGEMWRTGANASSTIQFSDDVIMDGQTVKAGKYAIFTIPEENNWTLFLYDETNNWGNQVQWDDKKVVAKTVVNVVKNAPSQETFSISLDHITMDSAMLTLQWGEVLVAAKIEVPTDKKAMASIQKTMSNNPEAQDYLDAANYYSNTNKDIQQAKTWIDTGIKMLDKPAFYQLYAQALIHYKAGDKNSALSIAKRSLEASIAANDGAYIRMNKELIEKIK